MHVVEGQGCSWMIAMGVYGCGWMWGGIIMGWDTDRRQNESWTTIFSRGHTRLYSENEKKTWFVVEGQR